MSLPGDLLEQAKHLAKRESRRPRQASLRRSVSSAYYALFHLLVDEAAKMLVGGKPLQCLVSRAFLHDEMKQASTSFAAGGLPPHVLGLFTGAVPRDLQLVASVFVDLQEARHEADYKVDRIFTRSEVQALVSLGDQAFQAWKRVRVQEIAKVYLASLLLWKRWR
ncbi:MAG: hypothetical protein WD278_04975 [Pirellulales bacterium]|jgi:uncharacterized protein (UPF0332 family)